MIYFPIEVAIGMTAIVHLLNNLFKFFLVGSHIHWGTIVRFGIPALVAAFLGARLLSEFSNFPPIMTYELFGGKFDVLWVKVMIAAVMIAFTLFEIIPRYKNLEFDQTFLPLGGVLSGFFCGLSGHQGALRSAFLMRAGLSKEAFIATGVAIACIIDVVRLGVYSSQIQEAALHNHLELLGATTLAAFVGVILGSRYLKKVTMAKIQMFISGLLLFMALLLGAGWI